MTPASFVAGVVVGVAATVLTRSWRLADSPLVALDPYAQPPVHTPRLWLDTDSAYLQGVRDAVTHGRGTS